MPTLDELPAEIRAFPGDGWGPTETTAREWTPLPVEVAPRVAIPRSFHVTIADAEDTWALTLLFIVDQREILFTGAIAGGEELHVLMARVFQIQPLRWWQQLSRDHAIREQRESDLDSYSHAVADEAARDGDTAPEATALQAMQAWSEGRGATPPVGRRRNRITDELLKEVAEVYRGAWSSGHPPTRAVADHFGKKHSTAANWVVRARKDGHLGPADGKQGGEVSES